MRAPLQAHPLLARGVLLASIAAVVGGAAVYAGQVLPDAKAASATTTLTTSITCGTDDAGIAAALREGPELCSHADAPPAGVDVKQRVSTAELKTRDGASDEAAAAAAQSGVVTAAATTANDTVACVGDGTSGARVQAMYVVEDGKPNRYNDLKDSIRQWAAGVDDVFNRSAALTGGVRNVRFVTETRSDGTCTPKVLNVTVPAGSTADLGKSSAALGNLGYNSTDRRYLSWVDANVYCGIAWMYTDSKKTQANINNSGYTSYARIDNGCWGMSQSVEAHELTHTLGAVQKDAPHATKNGHCTDESDRMCYVDGTGVKMTQVCKADLEALLDCGSNDYYSTKVVAGSYLATHWNAADSRFLIGGGDGSANAPANADNRPVVSIQSNPMVPGLPTQVGITVTPGGTRTVASVKVVPSTGCVLANTTNTQATVTCAATTTTAYVTVTATDSLGFTSAATKGPLTLDTTPRVVSLGDLSVNSAAYNAAPVCIANGTLATSVRDQATGKPVYGLPLVFKKDKANVATVPSLADGTAKVTTALKAASFNVTTGTAKAWKAASTANGTLSVVSCKTQLNTKATKRVVKVGKKIVVTGKLLATPAKGKAVAAPGAKVTVTVKPKGGKAVSLGTVTTGADGSWTVAAAPKVSGAVTVTAVRTSSYGASTASAGSVTVRK